MAASHNQKIRRNDLYSVLMRHHLTYRVEFWVPQHWNSVEGPKFGKRLEHLYCEETLRQLLVQREDKTALEGLYSSPPEPTGKLQKSGSREIYVFPMRIVTDWIQLLRKALQPTSLQLSDSTGATQSNFVTNLALLMETWIIKSLSFKVSLSLNDSVILCFH